MEREAPQNKQKSVEALKWVSRLDLPKGRVLLDHQKTAIEFAMLSRASYLGLDPGLGKAVVAACIGKLTGAPIVFITPSFLVENITSEFEAWAPELVVKTYQKSLSALSDANVIIISDSILTRPDVGKNLLAYRRMYGERYATLIVDEAHRFKNPKTGRLLALIGGVQKKKESFVKFESLARLFDRCILMSGTPMPNRPMELFPILSSFAPEAINHMDYHEFGKRYCGGKLVVIGWDKNKRQPKKRWDFKGSSNLKELGQKVIYPSGSFMLRIKKSAIKLPPKIEEVFYISKALPPHVATIERALKKEYLESSDETLKRLQRLSDDDLHFATYRKLLGLEKVKPTAEYISALMEETDESVIIFGIHVEAVEALAKALEKYKPYLITGKTPATKRQGIVKDFQSQGSKRRLIIGNIEAMGVGLTLTKAARVVLFEFSWVPGVNDQAADRAHRIGQSSTVLVQYMVYRNSFDHKVLISNFEKRASMRFI